MKPITIINDRAYQQAHLSEATVILDFDGVFYNTHHPKFRRSFLERLVANWTSKLEEKYKRSVNREFFDVERILEIVDTIGSGWVLDRFTGNKLRLSTYGNVVEVETAPGQRVEDAGEIENLYGEGKLDLEERIELSEKITEGVINTGENTRERYYISYDGFAKLELAFYQYLKERIPDDFPQLVELITHAIEATHDPGKKGYKADLALNPGKYGLEYNEDLAEMLRRLYSSGRKIIIASSSDQTHIYRILRNVLLNQDERRELDSSIAGHFNANWKYFFSRFIHGTLPLMSKPKDLADRRRLEQAMDAVGAYKYRLFFVEDTTFNLKGMRQYHAAHKKEMRRRRGPSISVQDEDLPGHSRYLESIPREQRKGIIRSPSPWHLYTSNVAVLSESDYEYFLDNLKRTFEERVEETDNMAVIPRLHEERNNPRLDFFTRQILKYADVVTTDVTCLSGLFLPDQYALGQTRPRTNPSQSD